MKFLNDSQEILASLQQFGKALMLPIAILSAAGLLLGIGSALSNPDTLRVYKFLDIQWLQFVFQLMAAAGNIVFANLPLLCPTVRLAAHGDKSCAR